MRTVLQIGKWGGLVVACAGLAALAVSLACVLVGRAEDKRVERERDALYARGVSYTEVYQRTGGQNPEREWRGPRDLALSVGLALLPVGMLLHNGAALALLIPRPLSTWRSVWIVWHGTWAVIAVPLSSVALVGLVALYLHSRP